MTELFDRFEVGREPRWPILLRLLGASLAFHMVVMASALYVPAVRDALNIASILSGASWVERPYSRTEIGDDVQIVQLTAPRFHYPEGYFAMGSEPVVVATPTPTPTPTPPALKIISQATPPLLAKPPITPSASPTPSTLSSAAPTTTTTDKSGTPENKTPQTPEEAQKDLEKTAEANDVDLPKEGEINKQALKDFAAEVNDLKNSGKLDLNQPFEIVIESELDDEGSLKDPKFTKKAGDENLVALSGRMIAVLNDSGLLVYLKKLNQDNPGTKVVFTVKQNQNEVLATVESDAASPESARRLSGFFNAMLALGATTRQGKDEEVLLRNTVVSAKNKHVVFNFAMPRQAVADLIKKTLASSEPPNGPG